ncbi:Molybdenum cofactor biosynthesis protein 1 [Aphelenchoides fujianensis]|nr:Molybdenum cofactor biosynthesis protein 1 [Aphelenchoides fujianensis]
MVDVGGKQPTVRIALAAATVQLTAEITRAVVGNALKKGDTAQLIPLCHNIPLADVQLRLFIDEPNNRIHVFCRAKSCTETGVEMEALTGASVACLTLYDMCKAISHEMTIGDVRLLGKRGGKRDFGVVDFDQLEADGRPM